MYIFVSANTKRLRMSGQHQTDGSERGRRSQRRLLPPSRPRRPSMALREGTITVPHGTKELQCTKEALIPLMVESVHSNKGIKVVHQWRIFKTPTLKSLYNHGGILLGEFLRGGSRRTNRST